MPLGGGSNVVFAGDFPGLIIRIQIQGREIVDENSEFVWLRVGAGENWHQLVEYCIDSQLWGLENLALIPGTVGAAPVQNIGAYGVELCDCFEELRAVEINSGVAVTFIREACGFGYRDSIFKGKLKGQYIITSVTLKLSKQPRMVCDYPALQQHFKRLGVALESPRQIYNAVCEIRQSKLPDPVEIPNAGSFFQNPLVSEAKYKQLQQQFPGIVGYPQDHQMVKLAAGWLIDNAGWRGFNEGGVGVHEKQALVLINPGHAKGKTLLALAAKIQHDILIRYDVSLAIEPQVVD